MERLPAGTHRLESYSQDRACPARTKKARAGGGAVLILSKHPAPKDKSGHKTNLPDPRSSIASGPALVADPLGTDDFAPFFSKPLDGLSRTLCVKRKFRAQPFAGEARWEGKTTTVVSPALAPRPPLHRGLRTQERRAHRSGRTQPQDASAP